LRTFLVTFLLTMIASLPALPDVTPVWQAKHSLGWVRYQSFSYMTPASHGCSKCGLPAPVRAVRVAGAPRSSGTRTPRGSALSAARKSCLAVARTCSLASIHASTIENKNRFADASWVCTNGLGLCDARIMTLPLS
jgi:hypothetical protein